MEYFHTMIRVQNLEESLHFFCDILGMVQVKRTDSEKGRFSLVFLSASGDVARTKNNNHSPTLELTYNWPDENGHTEQYTGGRNFGHLAYRVDNIYDICAKLQQHGIVINRPPRDGYMAFIKTPDSISIEFLQKGEPLAPQEPWVSMPNTGTW